MKQDKQKLLDLVFVTTAFAILLVFIKGLFSAIANNDPWYVAIFTMGAFLTFWFGYCYFREEGTNEK